MGIPALFRWLSTKYPKVTTTVVEEVPVDVDGHQRPIDFSGPNPNGEEFDNLYLDMNGIIHPCCHPEDKPAPATVGAMYVEIFKYIDRIVTMIRPRRILYMAIDGVAPRAKMNQQRSRRFRAAQEAQEKAEEEIRIRNELETKGGLVDKLPERHAPFDSNCITPGTPFMANLATCLRYYVADRLSNHPAWKNLKVILSDASVPGEGEHKVMDFIRRQRSQPGYDPNVHHVLYGLDADLIMLAIATHEVHFKILREDVFFKEGNSKGCFICGQTDHQAAQCTGKTKEKQGEFDEKASATAVKPYVFLHVNILREYLDIELRPIDPLPFAWDLERAVDDWVFLCFFVGNDFLPHLPSLEIREGAIDELVKIWKRNLPHFGGYLTDSGEIDLGRVERMLEDVGALEDDIFRRRREIEDRRRESRRRRREDEASAKARREQARQATAFAAVSIDSLPSYPVAGMSKEERAKSNKDAVESRRLDSNKAAADLLRKKLFSAQGGEIPSEAKTTEESTIVDIHGASSTDSTSPLKKRKADELESEVPEAVEALNANAVADDEEDETIIDQNQVTDIPPVITKKVVDDDEEPPDDVRLWETGWKKRYYRNKFSVEDDDMDFKKEIVAKYVEGFCWVLKYYYQGVQSWKWFYPYHYSPFASDFVGIASTVSVEFELGTPFRPFEQLMGVLPAASRDHIPKVFHKLMTEADSSIIDFYPAKFPVDMNGKKYAWQGIQLRCLCVALLPFIEESRLLGAMTPLYSLLSSEDEAMNEMGNEYLIVGSHHTMFESLCLLYIGQTYSKGIAIDPAISDVLFGTVLPDSTVCLPGSRFYSPLSEEGMEDIEDNQSISAYYFMPPPSEKKGFECAILSGANLPARVLDRDDYDFIRSGGGSSRGRGRGRGGYGRGSAADRTVRHNMGRREYNGRGEGDFYSSYNREYSSGPRGGYRDDSYGHTNKRPRYDQNYQSRDQSDYGQYNSYDSYGAQGYNNYGYNYQGSYNQGYSSQGYSSQGQQSHSNNYDDSNSYNGNSAYYSSYTNNGPADYAAGYDYPDQGYYSQGQNHYSSQHQQHGRGGGNHRGGNGNIGWSRNLHNSRGRGSYNGRGQRR